MKSKSPNPNDLLVIKGAVFQVPVDLGLHNSFFIPALRPKETANAVTRHYSAYEFKFVWAQRVENGVLGIRLWRVA